MFEPHGSAIRRYLRRLTGQSDLANDLTQDVYVRVVSAAERYEPREREEAWLFESRATSFSTTVRRAHAARSRRKRISKAPQRPHRRSAPI
jgi:DNA-directed RNA polymerase specialized sigma24 family protein